MSRFRSGIHVVGVVLGTSIVVCACGLGPEGRADPTSSDEVPFGLLDAEAPALVPEPDGSPFTVCLVADDTLHPVERLLEADATTVDILRSLGADVTDDEASQGLHTALPSDAELRAVTVRRGTAVVDFVIAPDLVGPAGVLAVAQFVCTLTYRPGIGQVGFTVRGAPLQVPIGDGSLSSGSVSLEDYQNLRESTP